MVEVVTSGWPHPAVWSLALVTFIEYFIRQTEWIWSQPLPIRLFRAGSGVRKSWENSLETGMTKE